MRLGITTVLFFSCSAAFAAGPKPAAIGGGRYMLTDQSATIFGTSGKIVAKLVAQANVFCQKSAGQDAVLLDSTGSEAVPGEANSNGSLKRPGKGATGTITFTCGQSAVKEPASSADVYTNIGKLKELLDSGAITQEEFNAEKKKLLGK